MRFKRGLPIHGTVAGRPRNLDATGVAEFAGAYNGTHTLPKLRSAYEKAVTGTARRYGSLADDEEVGKVGDSTFFKAHSTGKLTALQPQGTTVARLREEHDVRNFFTWAVLLFAFCENMLAELMFNWDATTFSCGNDAHNRKKVYVKQVPKTEWHLKVPPSTVGCSLGVYIKKLFLHNSAGSCSPPSYIIADDSMDDNTYEVHKVNGLGISSDPGNFGYLVFCKTRGCNKAFYGWFIKFVLLVFIAAVRDGLGDYAMV